MAGPELSIPIGVNLDKFRRGMDEAGAQTERTASGIEDAFKKINPDISGVFDKLRGGSESAARDTGNNIGVVIGAGISLALTGAIGGVIALVGNLAKLGDKADDMRLPVNLLQSLSVAAESARVPTENVTKALEKFTAASKLGGDDAKKFEKALGNIGDSFVKAFKDAGSQEERLKIISNALKSTTDEVKQAQLALQVFGTDNERVINLLGSGAKELDNYTERARALGLAIDDSLVKSAQEAKSQLSLLSRVLTDQFTSSLGELIPMLVRVLPYFQAIALAANAVAAVFANDATRSTKSLSDELNVLITRWVSMKEELNEIQSKQKTVAPADALRDPLRRFFGIDDDEVARGEFLIKELEKLEARTAELRKRIASGNAAPASESKPFAPRKPLDVDDTPRDRLDAATDAIEKRAKALEAETGALDQSTEARTRARVQAELETVAKQLNTEVTAEQTRRIYEVAAAWGKASAAAEQARAPLGRYARESANVGAALNNFAASSLDRLGDGLVDVAMGTKTVQQAFADMTKSILADLLKIALRRAILGPLAGGLNSMFPVGGGTGLYGQPGGPIGHPTGAGNNAAGTDDWRGGPTWVGERGPELLNLPRHSQIIPNNIASRMGGNSTNVVVNDYSGHAKVSHRPSSEGGGIDVMIPGLEAMLADRQIRGRGALAKVSKSPLRG